MKNSIVHTLMGLLLSLLSMSVSADNEKILVFRDAVPYDGHIPAIKAGIAMLKEFGAANKFTIDTTVNLSSFNSANLAKYDAVVFMEPYRDVGGGVWLNDTMNASEDSAFQAFMLSGKGLVGIHCADRLNNNSQWYLNLIGVQYLTDVGPQNCTYHVKDTNHPLSKGISQTFTNSQQVRGNKLFFSDTTKGFTVLIEADQKDFAANQKQSFYPFVWIHDYQGARVWCGSMGHTPQTFSSDPIWRKLMLNGILYALNRPGYGPTVATAPQQHRLTQAADQWTNRKQGLDGVMRVFDLSGRTVGLKPRNPLQSGMPFSVPFGTYIIEPNNGTAHPVPLRPNVD